jgi:hypothetical protein
MQSIKEEVSFGFRLFKLVCTTQKYYLNESYY